jgi:phosphoserine phosphatase
METHGIAVFDVCGTITKTNNTFHFISFVLRRDRTLRYGLLILIRILCPLVRLPGLRAVVREDLLRDGQIALLRGYSRDRLRKMAALYVEDLFARGLLNRPVLEAIQQEKSRGRTVLLVSSAIDPPIGEIARRLDIGGYFSSELELHAGRCTGRLKTDLLARKPSILPRIPAPVDWQGSSIYTDNREDADFMARFGQRTVVLNAPADRQAWNGGARHDDRQRSGVPGIATKGLRFLVNYEQESADKDVDSVNERTAQWVYVPLLYYVISRFHRAGVVSLLVREVVPVTLAAYLFLNVGVFSFLLVPLSFLVFYSVYEIGGLVNDLAARREARGPSGTNRISSQVHLNVSLFLAVRVVLVGLVLAWLSVRGYPALLYLGALGGCLALFLLHTLILGHGRVLTFFLLKICRNSIPLLILAWRVPPATLAWLCAIFSALDAPWRVYMYGRSRGLVRSALPVGHVRCLNTAVLWGLGAVLYVMNGSSLLLAIASYYVALEGLALLWRK